MGNGLAVIVSPLVFSMALLCNGPRLVGHSPYLYLLPLVVFIIEWLLISLSYRAASRSGWLITVRLVIFLISASFAVFAGLLSEGESLIQRLHKAEDALTLQSNQAKNLDTRLKAIDEQIAHNEKALMGRDAIETERLEALRLQELECHGKGGLDVRTGTFVKGGGACGVNADTHRINAEAASAHLVKLTQLDKETQGLVAQRGKLGSDLSALLESQRSPGDSLGSLGRALKEADGGLWFKIIAMLLIVLATEMLAIVMSKIAVPPTLQLAVQVSEEVDQIRLNAWHEASVAEVAKHRASQRMQLADGLAPLNLTLAASPKKSGETGPQRAEDKSEEVV